MLLSELAVVILSMTSSYAVNGKIFTIGYLSSGAKTNDTLQGPVISFANRIIPSERWVAWT